VTRDAPIALFATSVGEDRIRYSQDAGRDAGVDGPGLQVRPVVAMGGATEEGAMEKLFEAVARERRMQEQRREIRELRSEVEKLRIQNERMSEAMRRCLACDYRREVRERR
jgi:hypothetical protein